MSNNLEYALQELEKGQYTLVLYDGKEIIASKQRGIAPLLDLYKTKKDLSGFSAADKVIGRAAAFLYILLGIKEIYAKVISETSIELLNKNNVKIHYYECCTNIINRTGTDICPMEKSVLDIDEPLVAYKTILNRYSALNQNN